MSENKLSNENLNKKKNITSEDRIDIVELIISLWNKKYLIFLVTLIFSIFAIYFVYKKEDFFVAEIFLTPPEYSSVGLFINPYGIDKEKNKYAFLSKFGTRGIYKNIFNEFKNNLLSRKMQKKFILENNIIKQFSERPIDKIAFFETFSTNINIQQRHPNDTKFSVTLKAKDPSIAASTVNKFVKFINDETVTLLKKTSERMLRNQILEIELLMDSKRNMAKLRREDQIARLEEAKIIAENLGFSKTAAESKNFQSNMFSYLKNKPDQIPLFFNGTKAILSEISILKNRKSDDPYIKGLRDLQEELEILKNIDIKNSVLQATVIDQIAYPPKSPIGMDKKYIILFGVILGLLSGLLISILTFYFQIKLVHFKNNL